MNERLTTDACCTIPAAREDRFDLAVIGAGSAGFSAAITAAEGACVSRLSGAS